jgi:signal transduction histidine kinase
MPAQEKRQKFTLRPRARIVKTFGEELISNDYVAIIELIKNSYDADARIVNVSFVEPLQKGHGKLIIEDDGTGMSPADVQSGWMEPASVAKLAKRKSPSGRDLLGEKGIGRFSSAKLAAALTLITKKRGHPEVVAQFHWADFYKPEKYLDEIEGWWETRSPGQIKQSGTILAMEGLNTTWDDPKFRELRTYLSRLINPLRPAEDFQIGLNVPSDFEKYTGKVTPPESVQKPDYVIKGKLDSRSVLTAEYVSKKHKKARVLHEDILKLDSGKKPTCGPILYEFRVWDRDRFKDLAVELGSTVGNIRRDLDEIAGVSIFRDSFRVSPYGNPRNDWLRLDLRRVQNPTLRLSNNQIVGNILITSAGNPELRDQTNREGIVETDAFADLEGVALEILSLLETERYKERREAEIQGDDRKFRLFRDINLSSVREVVERKLPGDKEVEHVVAEKEREIKERVDEFRDFIVRYRRLSTLGQLVDIVLHDAGAALSRVTNGLSVIEREAKKMKTVPDALTRNISYSLEGQKLLGELFRRLEPFGGRKRERAKDIIAEEAIKDVFGIFAKEIEDLSVKIDIPDTRTQLRISESDFKIVFVNLLDNSLYWLRKESRDGNQIKVEVKKERADVEIVFSDNGPGIPLEDAPFVFDPYYTKKPGGIGLGLTIVGEFITESDGTLDLLESGPLKGASFRMKLPLR